MFLEQIEDNTNQHVQHEPITHNKLTVLAIPFEPIANWVYSLSNTFRKKFIYGIRFIVVCDQIWLFNGQVLTETSFTELIDHSMGFQYP